MRIPLLPPSRNGRILAIGSSVDSIGSGLFLAAATLYFVSVQGFPVTSVGLALSIGSIAGLVAPPVVGRIADRVGVRTMFLGLLLVRAVGYGLYAGVTEIWQYFILSAILAAADSASSPLLQALVSKTVAESTRTETLAAVRGLRNIGVGIGFLLAGLVQSWGSDLGFTALFLANGLSFLATALAVLRMDPQGSGVDQDKPRSSASSDEAGADSRPPYRSIRFVSMTFLNGLGMLHDVAILLLIPLWIVESLGLPPTWSSILLALNTLVVALSASWSGRWVGRRTSVSAAYLQACGVMAVGACVLACVGVVGAGPLQFTAILAGVVLLSLGENMFMAASWEASFKLAPANRVSEYLSFFSLGFAGQRAIGPILVASLFLPLGGLGWCLIAVLIAFSGIGGWRILKGVGGEQRT